MGRMRIDPFRHEMERYEEKKRKAAEVVKEMMMETKFNSQICTTKEQSERLLALGLRKETADCALFLNKDNEWAQLSRFLEWEKYADMFPAWSLHRLIEMADTTRYINEGREDEKELWFCMDRCYCWNNQKAFYAMNLYDSLINCIEWLIKEGYFKEYLV